MTRLLSGDVHALTRTSRLEPSRSAYKLVSIEDRFQRKRAVPVVAIAVIEVQIRLERPGRGHVETPGPTDLVGVGLLKGRLDCAEQLRSR